MPKFLVTHEQAVWERACFLVEAEDEEEARDKVHSGEILEVLWTQNQDAVEGLDDQILDVIPDNAPAPEAA